MLCERLIHVLLKDLSKDLPHIGIGVAGDPGVTAVAESLTDARIPPIGSSERPKSGQNLIREVVADPAPVPGLVHHALNIAAGE